MQSQHPTLKRFALAGLLIPVALLARGCAQRPPEPPLTAGEPLGLQMVRTEAQLATCPFRTLLEFEADTDPVFVRSEGADVKRDPTRQHTGTTSLMLQPGTRSITVRLPSLFSGSRFPGRWTLAGAYLLVDRPQRLDAGYEVDGQPLASISVQVPAGRWTPVMLDVATATDGKSLPIGTLKLTFPGGLSQPAWCDDVLVIDNTRTLVESPWTIRERGFAFNIDRPGQFHLVVQTPEAAADGWQLEQVNPIRAHFSSPGAGKSRFIYSDGRQIIDGTLSLLGPAANADAAAHHLNPGQIRIAPEMGRVNRNAPGDLNNDGYAERSGSYQVIAASPRLELTIAPRSRPLFRPVLEISGLPEGDVLVNMEGRLVEQVARTPDGRVLVVLPGTLGRPTLVNLRVSQR